VTLEKNHVREENRVRKKSGLACRTPLSRHNRAKRGIISKK